MRRARRENETWRLSNSTRLMCSGVLFDTQLLSPRAHAKLKKRMAISIAVGLLISIRWILLDKPLADKPLDLETAIGLVIIAHSCWVLLTIRSFESKAEKGEGGM